MLLGGNYQLQLVQDSSMTGKIELPATYEAHIHPMNSDESGTSQPEDKYRFGIKIGNSIGCTLTIDPASKTASTAGCRGTRMMPPPEVYKVESAVNDILTNLKTVEAGEDGLIFKSESGSHFQLIKVPE